MLIDKIGKEYYPPCRKTCPAEVNIQAYIPLITQGKFKEALEVTSLNLQESKLKLGIKICFKLSLKRNFWRETYS